MICEEQQFVARNGVTGENWLELAGVMVVWLRLCEENNAELWVVKKEGSEVVRSLGEARS